MRRARLYRAHGRRRNVHLEQRPSVADAVRLKHFKLLCKFCGIHAVENAVDNHSRLEIFLGIVRADIFVHGVIQALEIIGGNVYARRLRMPAELGYILTARAQRLEYIHIFHRPCRAL